MVKRVTVEDVQPQAIGLEEELGSGHSLLSWCMKFPWEQLVNLSSDEPRSRVSTSHARSKARPAPPEPVKIAVAAPPRPVVPVAVATHRPGPGCQAADACLLVHNYLVHLAEGKSGFGVLGVAKERLEEGAAGAARMGEAKLAQEMRIVAQELPQVTTPEAAAALAPKLKALSDQTWDLGRRCGGHNLSPAALEQARGLARDVKEGKLSMEEAVKQVRQEK